MRNRPPSNGACLHQESMEADSALPQKESDFSVIPRTQHINHDAAKSMQDVGLVRLLIAILFVIKMTTKWEFGGYGAD